MLSPFPVPPDTDGESKNKHRGDQSAEIVDVSATQSTPDFINRGSFGDSVTLPTEPHSPFEKHFHGFFWRENNFVMVIFHRIHFCSVMRDICDTHKFLRRFSRTAVLSLAFFAKSHQRNCCESICICWCLNKFSERKWLFWHTVLPKPKCCLNDRDTESRFSQNHRKEPFDSLRKESCAWQSTFYYIAREICSVAQGVETENDRQINVCSSVFSQHSVLRQNTNVSTQSINQYLHRN